MSTIAERIKEVRKEKKYTQAEFGKIIGVAGNTVTGYENNIRKPSDAVIISICREFNVNEEWLRILRGICHNKNILQAIRHFLWCLIFLQFFNQFFNYL